mmetsp:Transcript_17865/g.50633  ORF Transcript_17865/g.50633 Transcript_17865/m.50633 type:complete len:521 (-) Transcript_17865:137-1699(-)
MPPNPFLQENADVFRDEPKPSSSSSLQKRATLTQQCASAVAKGDHHGGGRVKQGSDSPSSSSSSSQTESNDVAPDEGNGKATRVFVEGDDAPLLDFRNASEWISFVCGAITLVVVGPPIGLVVFTSMIWEAIDRGFDGGFVDSGKELTGFIFTKFIPWLEAKTHTFNAKFVKRREDAYMMNCIVGYGVIIPAMFFACAYHAYRNGLSLPLAFVYHLIRIGPFFMNFAYVYTLAHKEGHSFNGLFAKPYNDYFVLRNVFNWWIGMFYGVLPAVFAYGHSINHHRYSNGPYDVVTNSDKPRDNFFNWVAYIPRFLLYNVNISTTIQFANEKRWATVGKVIYGSVYFFVWVAIWAWAVGPAFALTYLAFPFFEAALLLAGVNWSWHAFFDPDEPDNEFIQSITILDGTINVLNEDSHVVHHQYPGAHWTEHPKHLNKFWEQYMDRCGSVFQKTHTFEIFGMSVIRDYDGLAKKFVVAPNKNMTHEEKVVLMKKRLRGCWWGPRAQNKAAAMQFTGEATQKKTE